MRNIPGARMAESAREDRVCRLLGRPSYKPYECQLGRAIPSNGQSDSSETAIRVQAQITDFS